jgi:hypothetical protein
MDRAKTRRERIKREVLIDRQLHRVLEEIALESDLTADKLGELFIFWGIMQLTSLAGLHEGRDPVRDALEDLEGEEEEMG